MSLNLLEFSENSGKISLRKLYSALRHFLNVHKSQTYSKNKPGLRCVCLVAALKKLKPFFFREQIKFDIATRKNFEVDILIKSKTRGVEVPADEEIATTVGAPPDEEWRPEEF